MKPYVNPAHEHPWVSNAQVTGHGDLPMSPTLLQRFGHADRAVPEQVRTRWADGGEDLNTTASLQQVSKTSETLLGPQFKPSIWGVGSWKGPYLGGKERRN